jgi:hypothetical protein
VAKKTNLTPKKKMGAPTKYKAEYCDEVVSFMGRGFSVEAFAGHVSVSKETLYNWMEEYPDFKAAVAVGREKCRIWWEEAGHQGIFTGKDTSFSAATWIFNMRNRFGWRNEDKTEASAGDTAAGGIIRNGDIDKC